MTYALCADIHCHAWSQFAVTRASGINSRLEHILFELERMAKEAARQGCKRIYVAGDTFHVRGSVKPSVLNPVQNCLDRLGAEYGLEWIVMPGNHDLEGNETSELSASITTLGRGDSVTVVNEPTFFADDKVAIIPWHNTRVGLSEAITGLRERMQAEHIDPNDYDLHLHTGINGVLIGMPDHGWAPEELAGFGFRRVFSGHYHNHKVFDLVLDGDDHQVVSIGALTHQTWSDVNTRAGWLIVDAVDFSFIENEQPKFRDLDPELEPIEYAGDYVRVKGLELTEAEKRELRDAYEEAGVAGIVIHAITPAKMTARPGTTASKAVTVESSICEWIKLDGMANAEAVEREALEVMKEAQSHE